MPSFSYSLKMLIASLYNPLQVKYESGFYESSSYKHTLLLINISFIVIPESFNSYNDCLLI